MILSESYRHMNKNSYQTTLEKALSVSEFTLKNAHIESARLDSQLIMAHVINKSRAWIMSHTEFLLSPGQLKHSKSLTKLRAANTPFAYISKEKEFYRRVFYCDERVLVPRPESEQIISSIFAILPKKTLSIIDIGCGSGILGITTQLENPYWKITLSDVSRGAIEVAKRNVKHYDLSSKISLIECDLLPENKVYDVVIANLPYVPTGLSNKPDISREPKIALFAGKDGLDLYRRLFKQLGNKRSRPTFVFIESLKEQQTELINIANADNYNLVKKTDYCLSFIFNPTYNN